MGTVDYDEHNGTFIFLNKWVSHLGKLEKDTNDITCRVTGKTKVWFHVVGLNSSLCQILDNIVIYH